METALLKEGVQIIGYASDGDTRLLKAMKVKNNLSDFSVNCPILWKSFFCAEYKSDYQCVQDTIHIANKLKNRLLKKTGAPIIMGKYYNIGYRYRNFILRRLFLSIFWGLLSWIFKKKQFVFF